MLEMDGNESGYPPSPAKRPRHPSWLITGGRILTVGALLFSGVLGGFYLKDKQLNGGLKPIGVSSRDLHPVDREDFYDERVLAIQEGTYSRLGDLGKYLPGIDSGATVVASATCHAGIDHKKTEPQYQVDGQQVTATLGQAEVFDCGDLEIRFIQGKGIVQVPEEFRNQLTASALDELKKQAARDGLDDKAQAEAAIREEVKLRRLGFDQVIIKFKKPLPPELAPQTPSANPVSKPTAVSR